MALTTVQKVVMFSCLVLCVSLLLPRAHISRGKPPAQEGNSRPSPSPTEGRPGSSYFPRSHMAEAMSKAKSGNGGGGGGSRPSLVGQIIPIYGFGILLYILYILFKLSSKGKNSKLEPSSQPSANGNLKRKITDYELSQLQDKLKETEEAMEQMISRMGPNSERSNDVNPDEEKHLLQRLQEITRVMKQGKVLDGISPEQEAEEAPYMEDWEGYPEETYPVHNPSEGKRAKSTILVDRSVLSQPSAEEIAEGMGFGDEEGDRGSSENENKKENYKQSVECEQPSQVAFSSQETCEEDGGIDYEEEEDDPDDPEVIAENAGFFSDRSSDPGDSDELFTDSEAEGETPNTLVGNREDDGGNLRKRNPKV